MSRSFLASTKLVSWLGLCLLLPASLLQFRGLAWLSATLLGGVGTVLAISIIVRVYLFGFVSS